MTGEKMAWGGVLVVGRVTVSILVNDERGTARKTKAKPARGIQYQKSCELSSDLMHSNSQRAFQYSYG